MIVPPSRPPAVALALGAVALAAVITVVGLFILGIGPFGAPAEQPSISPSPAPSSPRSIGPAGSPSTSPSQEQSAGPTSAPAASPTPSRALATPSSANDVLLTHVPEALRPTCTPGSFDAPALALVTCNADAGAIILSYTLYADQPSMAAVYDAAVVAAGIDVDSGRCYNGNGGADIVATTSRWPSENGYTIQDQPVGRYLCHADDATATVTWTDDRLYVLARASSGLTAVDRLIAFWIEEAGPVE